MTEKTYYIKYKMAKGADAYETKEGLPATMVFVQSLIESYAFMDCEEYTADISINTSVDSCVAQSIPNSIETYKQFEKTAREGKTLLRIAVMQDGNVQRLTSEYSSKNVQEFLVACHKGGLGEGWKEDLVSRVNGLVAEVMKHYPYQEHHFVKTPKMKILADDAEAQGDDDAE